MIEIRINGFISMIPEDLWTRSMISFIYLKLS